MTDDVDRDATLPPDEAFAVLGNETRMGILRALGDADGPLSFSELRDRVGTRDSGRFNYHLERLAGHFVRKTGDGYALGRPGRRVIEAVLSGALTDDPAFDRTRVDESCEYCGASIEIRWHEGSVELYCTECAGRYAGRRRDPGGETEATEGYLGQLPFPPAGLRERTPGEVLRAAWTWGNLEILAMAAGICPRCSATVEYDISLCEDHDAADGACEACGDRYAAGVGVECTNCVFESGGVFVIVLLDHPALLSFLLDHDINPVSPESIRRNDAVHGDYEEEILATDPFEARFTFEVDGDTLALTVKGTTVTDVAR